MHARMYTRSLPFFHLFYNTSSSQSSGTGSTPPKLELSKLEEPGTSDELEIILGFGANMLVLVWAGDVDERRRLRQSTLIVE